MKKLQSKSKKIILKENNLLKKYIPLQCFNKQLIVLQILKSKENEEISFSTRSCCSYLIRILW